MAALVGRGHIRSDQPPVNHRHRVADRPRRGWSLSLSLAHPLSLFFSFLYFSFASPSLLLLCVCVFLSLSLSLSVRPITMRWLREPATGSSSCRCCWFFFMLSIWFSSFRSCDSAGPSFMETHHWRYGNRGRLVMNKHSTRRCFRCFRCLVSRNFCRIAMEATDFVVGDGFFGCHAKTTHKRSLHFGRSRRGRRIVSGLGAKRENGALNGMESKRNKKKEKKKEKKTKQTTLALRDSLARRALQLSPGGVSCSTHQGRC